MGRQLLNYVPANLVPAAASILMVVVYTRLLSPAEFGRFNLAFSAVLIVQMVGFNGLAFATSRFYPAARTADASGLLRHAYAAFGLLAMLVSVASLLAALLLPAGAVPAWTGLLLPLALLRSLVGQNQAVNRAADGALRFNLVECAHAVLGFVAGLALVLTAGPQARNPLLGLLLAALLCAAFEWRGLRAGFSRGAAPPDRRGFADLQRFAWPLSVSFGATCLLQYGDRFLLDFFGGPQTVGPYAVAWSLVERPTTLLSMAVSLATFQGVVQAMEQHGREAARVQLGGNGIALLALIAPGCAGLALSAAPIAAVMVGPEFRAPVAGLIPVMAATALVRCMSVHFVDHAFHLARRSGLMLAVYLPAALGTLALDLWLVPRFGGNGAAWSALACQTAALLTGAVLGRRIFPLTLPWVDAARVAASTAAMAAVLALLRVPPTALGLLFLIAAGCASYGLALLVVGLVRPQSLLAALSRRGPAALPAGKVQPG